MPIVSAPVSAVTAVPTTHPWDFFFEELGNLRIIIVPSWESEKRRMEAV